MWWELVNRTYLSAQVKPVEHLVTRNFLYFFSFGRQDLLFVFQTCPAYLATAFDIQSSSLNHSIFIFDKLYGSIFWNRAAFNFTAIDGGWRNGGWGIVCTELPAVTKLDLSFRTTSEKSSHYVHCFSSISHFVSWNILGYVIWVV